MTDHTKGLALFFVLYYFTPCVLVVSLIVLVVIRLMGVIDWPWTWVLAPAWVPVVLVSLRHLACHIRRMRSPLTELKLFEAPRRSSDGR